MGWLIHGHFTPNYLSMFILQIIGCVITTYINLKILKIMKEISIELRNEVISKLELTIGKLYWLHAESRRKKKRMFNYAIFVEELKTDESGTVKECGTICCVAGWYPQWFKNCGLEYTNTYDDIRSSIGDSIEDALKRYHKLSTPIIDALFYGNEDEQEDLGLPFTDLDSKLSKVIQLFEVALVKIKNGELDNEIIKQ